MSRWMQNSNSTRATSRLMTAIQMVSDIEPQLPDGQFGRSAVVRSGDVTVDSKELDFEFTISFDDDPEVNESEIIFYNLTDSTISGLKLNADITIEAGYQNDTGVILVGKISTVSTKWDGVDKITTLKVLDNQGVENSQIESKTYTGRTASEILRDLVGQLGLPIGDFPDPPRDHLYPEDETVDGELMEAIKKYAEVCGVSVYINRGLVYVRPLSVGDNIKFTASVQTGLIDSPEEFTETVEAEDYTDTIHGYKLKLLLQHRMTTAAIINIESKEVRGTYRVRSGKHTFNESEAITEIEVVDS